MPAINELRYAGYHLHLSLDSGGVISDIDQLRKAKSHAQRACYEAAEAGLVISLKEISLFKNDYKDVIVTEDVQDYVDILSAAHDAQKRLES